MKNKEEFITEEKVINTPAGGVLIGKDKDGQTIIPNDGSLGGFLVGRLHKDGGIKAINKGTGQPLEMQSNEVVITAPAVADTTKREFEGKMMTNREILSAINEKGGGVSFADGGDIPAKIHTTDCEYKFGGKVVKDTDIAHSLGMNSTLKKGKQHFSSGNTTYDVDAIYNAIKKGKLRLKTKEVETFPMKYPVYDKNYAENHKIDFRKPNGITVRTESGEEVLIDGNHRMNNAYSKGRKTMKTYYIEDPKQIAKFSKKNKFELGGENKTGGHLSSGKSLKQIAEMHNVSLAHINEELAKGLEVEKEHFSDFKERTRVAKDHLVENPNYYTILEKAGLKKGGHLKSHHKLGEDLVEDAKSGNTPARDLNNYNDVLDLEADGMVGADSGLAFANGGQVSNFFKKTYGNLVEKQGIITTKTDWFNKDGVKVLQYGFDPYRYEKGNTLFFYSWDYDDSGMDYDDFKEQLVDFFKKTYKKDVSELKALYVGWDRKEKDTYADGGITPIDANIEGDSVDIVESDFAKGGVVYDTTKPKIEKITIKDTKFNRTSVIGRNATTVSEFQQIVSDYIGNTPKEDVDWISFYVNDSTRGSYYIDLNKGKKNTVKNVNPETLNSLNFRRVIDAKTYLVKNYDWTDFFELGSQTTSTSTKTPLTKEELLSSKIWIGDNVELKDKVINKLIEIGIPFDKQNGDPDADKNINVIIFDFDFIILSESKDEFNLDRRKEIFLEDLGIDVTTTGVTPTTSNASTSAKPLSLSNTKVWLGYDYKQNLELSKKIQEKAFELGWGWFINGKDKKLKDDIQPQAFYFNDKNEMTYSSGLSGRDYFDKNEGKELTREEILSIPTPTSSQSAITSNYEDTVESVIINYGKFNGYIATNIEKLLDEIKRLWKEGGRSEMEITLQPQNVNGLLDNTFYLTLDNVSNGIFTIEPDNISLSELKDKLSHFYALDWSKFFNVFGNASSSAKPFDFSMTKIDVMDNVDLSLRVQQKAFEEGWEWENGGGKNIKNDPFNYMYFTKSSISFGNTTSSFDNSPKRKITEAEIFGSQAPASQTPNSSQATASNKKIVDYIIVKEPRSFPNGEKVYRGSGLLPLLKDIYIDSPIADTKVEIDLVVNGKAEDAPLTLTLTGVPTYSDYEINPNDINEQILYGKLKLEWFPEYNLDRLYPLLDELDFYLSESYLSNFKTKNINELYSKLNTPEVKNSDKEITLIWFGENGETHKFGAYFTNDATVYYQIDRDNFTLDLLRGKLDDWFYGRLSENYMFPDGQVKAKTPTSNSAVPKTFEQGVYNLDLAVQKLEKASSSVVTEYNKDIYDQSLKFLYDTKASYELALKFTPESAFMYERLDILKKLADIEKKIKNIEDMKKGGTFYMLAKILEKLERGENWKILEQSQDVITNQIPQSEIDVIIRSQKFKNWFGDWEKALINDEYDNVSKALTNGIPSVYHHGARRIKYTYREVSNGVLYLAENISYAVWFSQNATAQSEEGNYLTECFVNIKNPIDLTAFHVNKVDLGDIVRYVDAVYPMAKIYDFIPAQVALLIKTNQPTNVRMWAWQLIRSYAKFVNHIKENTPYDGFLYYENNPSDEVVNPATGQLEENVTKAVAIFKSHQVKVVDAVLFDGGLDDWRFENGGKIKN
jgi:hypothetical protein